MKLRAAIVGCGKIADGHVEELQKRPELAEVVAVCDLEPLMAEQLAARYSIPHFYADLAELLQRHSIDVLHITTPPRAHLPLVQQAVAAGCHVLVEKPLTPSHEQTAELIATAERAGRLLTAGYTYLFEPPALAMRELLQQGVLGDVVHVESCYGYSLSGPFGAAVMSDPKHWVHGLPGGLIQNNIDHLLNKFVEFFPDEDPQIDATGAVLRTARFGDARDNLFDEMRLTLSGKRVTGFGMFSSHARPTGHYCRVYGTRNTATVDYRMRTVTLDSGASLPSSLGRLVPAFETALRFIRAGSQNVLKFANSDFHFFAGLGVLIERFYASITQGTAPPIPYRDLLWVSRVADQIYRQLEASRAGANS